MAESFIVPEEWFNEDGEPPEKASTEWFALIAAIVERSGFGICGAKKTSGKGKGWPCRKPPMTGGRRCRKHGGRSPRGPASASWKNGQYSYHVPNRLADKADSVMHDPDYLSLRPEIAVAEARHQELLDGLTTGETGEGWKRAQEAYGNIVLAVALGADTAGPMDSLRLVLDEGVSDSRKWDELRRSGDHIRKLKNTERARLEALTAYMTAEGGTAFVGRLMAMLKEIISDQQMEKLMYKIQSQQLLRAQARPVALQLDFPTGRQVG